VKGIIVAIDGPAGAGKSTVARKLADALGYVLVDTGAMYRCVALADLRGAADPVACEIGLGDRITLDGEDVTDAIRSPEVSMAASRVSVHPEVREALVEQQRALIDAGNYVAEGRDIGTVVSPGAPLKIFLTATDSERARRRAAQSGEAPEAVLAAQAARDARDRDRAHGALRPAQDSIELDTTGLDADEVVDRVVALARDRGLART
jgi:cytidylate kinase